MSIAKPLQPNKFTMEQTKMVLEPAKMSVVLRLLKGFTGGARQ